MPTRRSQPRRHEELRGETRIPMGVDSSLGRGGIRVHVPLVDSLGGPGGLHPIPGRRRLGTGGSVPLRSLLPVPRAVDHFVTAPAYVTAFWLWGRASRRHSWVDSGWTPILGLSGAISVAPAIAVAALLARGPSRVQFGDFVWWVPWCVAVFWGAIALPRWLLDSLHPGIFSEPS